MVNSTEGTRSRFTLPLILALVLIPAAVGLWLYLDRAASNLQPVVPAAITAEEKAYATNLKVSGVEMKATANYAGAAIVEITGNIMNSGSRQVERAELNCIFYDTAGLVVLRERVPIVKSTLKPGETKSFRLPFEGISESWNQAMPQLVIARVTFAQ